MSFQKWTLNFALILALGLAQGCGDDEETIPAPVHQPVVNNPFQQFNNGFNNDFYNNNGFEQNRCPRNFFNDYQRIQWAHATARQYPNSNSYARVRREIDRFFSQYGSGEYNCVNFDPVYRTWVQVDIRSDDLRLIREEANWYLNRPHFF